MLVEDIGPADAKIMIVGEAPGKTEEETGMPFTGSSGKLLRQMLQHSVYNKKSRNEPSDRLLYWHSVLRDKIEKIRPNVVIALGAEALRAITNRRGIKNWRGTVLTYKDVKVIATYHPAAVIRQYDFHPIVEMDLAKALRESKFRELKYDECSIITKPTLRQTLDWLNECSRYPRVGWDIETVGRHVRCIGIARGSALKPEALVVPFIKFPSTDMVMPGQKNIISVGNVSYEASSYWNSHDELLVLDAIAKVMEGRTIQKVGHNSIAFDASVMKSEFKMEVNNHIMDTMHAFHLLYSELHMGLKFLVTILTNYPNYWADRQSDNDESEWHYNGMDAIATLVISYKLETELHNAGMMNLYKHINDLAIALTRIQERGICIDDDARKAMLEEQNVKLDKILKDISNVAGGSFNPNSPKQVKELLYDKLKFPIVYKDGKETTGEAALKKLAKRYPKERVLNDIVAYRKTSKLINTFLDMNLDADGKMRTSYNASGTKSGRISSSKTIWKTGMNLQNIPVGKAKGVESIRHLFIPSKGKIFVKADLVQAEALVVAEILSRHGDPTLAELHKNKDFDVHRWMASHIFNKPESEVTKHERNIGKLANHSGNYGAGPKVLTDKAAKEDIEGIDYRMAKRILEVRHRAIPGLKKWWRYVERKVRETRTLTTCFGRRRIFFGRMDESTFRDAYSFEPQSVVGEVTNRILTKIELNPNSKLTLLLQVHDEIDGECYERDLDEVVKEIKAAATVPIYINESPLIIPVDIEVGKNWGDLVSYKEYRNGKR